MMNRRMKFSFEVQQAQMNKSTSGNGVICDNGTPGRFIRKHSSRVTMKTVELRRRFGSVAGSINSSERSSPYECIPDYTDSPVQYSQDRPYFPDVSEMQTPRRQDLTFKYSWNHTNVTDLDTISMDEIDMAGEKASSIFAELQQSVSDLSSRTFQHCHNDSPPNERHARMYQKAKRGGRRHRAISRSYDVMPKRDLGDDKNWKSVNMVFDSPQEVYRMINGGLYAEVEIDLDHEISKSDSMLHSGRKGQAPNQLYHTRSMNDLSDSTPVKKTNRSFSRVMFPTTISPLSTTSGSFPSPDVVDFSSSDDSTPNVTAPEDVMGSFYRTNLGEDELHTGEKPVDVPDNWMGPIPLSVGKYFRPAATSTPMVFCECSDHKSIGKSPRLITKKTLRYTKKKSYRGGRMKRWDSEGILNRLGTFCGNQMEE